MDSDSVVVVHFFHVVLCISELIFLRPCTIHIHPTMKGHTINTINVCVHMVLLFLLFSALKVFDFSFFSFCLVRFSLHSRVSTCVLFSFYIFTKEKEQKRAKKAYRTFLRSTFLFFFVIYCQ